jgi:hypothetical protein
VVITSLKSSINATESGCEIVINTILDMSAVGEKNDRVTVITDGYLKNCETENRYNDLPFSRIVSAENVKGATNAETLLTDAELDALEDIVFITALPKAERVETKDGVVTVFGEIKYSGLAVENVEGNQSYASIKFSSPFVEYVNESCHNSENTRYKVKIIAEEPVAELDADKVYLSCGLRFDVLVSEDKSVRYVAECMGREGERYMKEKATVRVYYPDENEDAFSVARKFHIAVSKLCADNNLNSEASTFERTDLPKKLIIN